MINRVTQQTMQRSTLANVQLNLARMSDLQARMSGGKVITKPSDDPAGTAQAMTLRAAQRATQQHARNADDGVGWLSAIDSALTASAAHVRRARDLTVQGANAGTMSQASREAIAIELEGVRDALLAQANTEYLGRSVFAGTSNAGSAFSGSTGTPPYTWTGTPGATVDRRVAEGAVVRADSDGVAAFGEGTGSVFALIDTIAAELRAGGSVSPRLGDLDVRLEAMLGELGSVGTRYGQMTAAQSATADALLDLRGQLSDVEDIDLAKVIMDLEMQEVAYKGALGAAGRVLQPTLMEFLR